MDVNVFTLSSRKVEYEALNYVCVISRSLQITYVGMEKRQKRNLYDASL